MEQVIYKFRFDFEHNSYSYTHQRSIIEIMESYNSVIEKCWVETK